MQHIIQKFTKQVFTWISPQRRKGRWKEGKKEGRKEGRKGISRLLESGNSENNLGNKLAGCCMECQTKIDFEKRETSDNMKSNTDR